MVSDIKNIDELFTSKSKVLPEENARICLDYEYYRKFTSEASDDLAKYGCVMFRLLEHLLSEGQLAEFMEAVKSRTDLFERMHESASFKAFADAVADLYTLMELSSEGEQNPDKILLSWASQGKDGTPVSKMASFLKEVIIQYTSKEVLPDGDIKWEGKAANYFFREYNIQRDTLLAESDNAKLNQVKSDAVFGHILSEFLRAPILLAQQTHFDNSEGNYRIVFDYYKPSSKNGFEEQTLFRGSGRSYSLLNVEKSWYLLYNVKGPLIPITELLHPFTCILCGKEVAEFFTSTECRFHHKYHAACIRNLLDKKCNKDVNELISGLMNHEKPQPTCWGCETLLSLKDLKALYPEYFKVEYFEKINAEHKERLQLFDKDGAQIKLSRSELMEISPFKREQGEETNKFALSVQDKAKPEIEYKIYPEDFTRMFNGPSNQYYTNFCAQCGKVCRERLLFRLSCRHICCLECAIPLLAATEQKYVKENPLWPICMCLHCGELADLVSLQLHEDHYISLPHLLEICLLNKQKLDHCVVKDCTEKIDIGPVLELIKYSTENDNLSKNSLLKIENLGKDIKHSKITMKWLSNRYSLMESQGENYRLIGYGKSFAQAKAEVLAAGEKIEPVLLNFESKFTEFLARTRNWSDAFDKIKACEIIRCRTVGALIKEYYIDSLIFGSMYDYEHDYEVLFTPIEEYSEDMKAMLKGSFLTSGAFGRGCYLSRDPSIIHLITPKKGCNYHLAAVCLAKPKESHKVRTVCPNDHKRVAGDLQELNRKDEKTMEIGKMKGEVLTVKKDDNEIIVAFEPSLIVPISIVTYAINFTKF